MECWRIVFVFFLSILMAVTAAAQQVTQSPSQHAARTRVVLLGTGTPVPGPDRSGPHFAALLKLMYMEVRCMAK
jgi:hypothetical protein